MKRLSAHMADVHLNSKNIFDCDVCGRKFGRKETIRRHMEIHTIKEFRGQHFKCDVCLKFYVSKVCLRIHRRVKHSAPNNPNAGITCQCGRIFYNKLKFCLHNRQVHRKHFVERKCDICGRFFNDVLLLEDHIKNYHVEEFSNLIKLRKFPERINYLETLDENEFKLRFRLSKASFKVLLEKIRHVIAPTTAR